MAAIDLAAMPPVVIVRGIANWLGLPEQPDTEPEETWEALCARISKEAA